MQPYVFFALVGAGLYAGYRVIRSLGEQAGNAGYNANDAVRQRAEGTRPIKDLGLLELDLRTGLYRPAKHD